MRQIIDEIKSIVGTPTDPDTGEAGIVTELDDDDGIMIVGEKIATVANFATDKTKNEILEQLEQRLPEILAGFHSSIEGYYRTLTAMSIKSKVEHKAKGVTVITIPREAIMKAQHRKITAEQNPATNELIITISQER